uniref:16S rRNA (Guanine(527)-N(7))-methyltransferase RsmG n=1 Tax=Macrostomum lignano TaxID=282301 RepID=A0A1I8IWY2_9PLAT
MLSDKRYGLTFNLIATKVLPHLIPYTVNPNLRRSDFCVVMETLNTMWLRLESGRSAQMRLEEGTPGDFIEESGVKSSPGQEFVRRISKTGSSPSFNLRTSPRKGSVIDISGAAGLS